MYVWVWEIASMKELVYKIWNFLCSYSCCFRVVNNCSYLTVCSFFYVCVCVFWFDYFWIVLELLTSRSFLVLICDLLWIVKYYSRCSHWVECTHHYSRLRSLMFCGVFICGIYCLGMVCGWWWDFLCVIWRKILILMMRARSSWMSSTGRR